MAQNKRAKWIKSTAALYGKQVNLWYQTMDALWYPSAGQRLLRIVVVRDPSGRRRDDYFLLFDLTPHRHANPGNLFATLALGSLVPRR